MRRMPFDGSVSVRIRRPGRVLVRIGRWTLVSLILCLALIGFLHLTRGTGEVVVPPSVTFAESLPMVHRLV